MATSAQNQEGAQNMGAMNIFMPLMTVYFAFIMPGALGIYWIAGSVFGIIQDVILNRHFARKFALEDADFKARMAAREKAYEAKRQETERLKAMNATERNENTSSRKKRTAERQQQLEKAKEYEKKKNNESTQAGPSQVGRRKYARGRAYDPDRYADDGVEGAVSSEDAFAEQEQILQEQEMQQMQDLTQEPDLDGDVSEQTVCPPEEDEPEEPVDDTEDTDEEETDD
jgi:YidC/Oxa1 family membrane protein insertase